MLKIQLPTGSRYRSGDLETTASFRWFGSRCLEMRESPRLYANSLFLTAVVRQGGRGLSWQLNWKLSTGNFHFPRCFKNTVILICRFFLSVCVCADCE